MQQDRPPEGDYEKMLSHAPTTLALGQRLEDLLDRRRDIQQLVRLTQKHHLAQQFPDLPNHLNSLLAQAEGEFLDALKTQAAPSPIYEVSVADAAEALGVSENTIRSWDRNGNPYDPTYPGRFNVIIFYQWAAAYKSVRRFTREAKKRAMQLNSSEVSISQK